MTGSRAVERPLDGARDLLADDHAHAAADEAVLHRRDDALDAADAAGRGDDRVLAARCARCWSSSRCRYGLVSVNCSGSVDVRPASCSSHSPSNSDPQALGRGQPEVMRALRADAEAGREILVVDDLRARRTLDPQPFGHPALVRPRLDRLAVFLEPGHRRRIHHNSRGVLASAEPGCGREAVATSAIDGPLSCCVRR